ncbi:MAG: ribosome biogenesis GTPase Der, partial [Anaerolineae bacterium]|nr:ribosome biogenesis GTPase Der [Anaerolineae bacterium]
FITDIRSQAQVAIEESDAVLFLTDGGTGPTSPDREVAQILRRSQKKLEDGSLWPPIYLIVNKCENKARREAAIDFYELGLGEPHPISAMHGTNLGDLLDLIVAAFPETEAEADDSVKFAIVGKPNAGKSSLLNKLVGKERAIVSPIAGTTRDAVDTQFEYEGIPLTLIDTAGIRKRGKIDPGVERYSVVRAKKAIERADVALLMIDAETGITAQDLHIAGFILDAWKSTIVVVNKWDSIEKDSYTMNYYTEKILYELNFMPYVPLLFISALTGQRVEKVLPLALKVQEARLTHISTSKLNKILRDALDAHPAPSKGGRQLKIYYATQVRSDPPTFLVYVNDHKLMHFSYRRFLENQIRAAYEFIGTPIRIVLKGKAKKEK